MDELGRSPAETVLASVQADPRAAADAARRLLTESEDERERAIARWALGFAEREFGDLASAEIELRAAADHAGRLGDAELEARIITTLAVVVLNRGFPDAALEMIERPIAVLDGEHQARAIMQRGLIKYRLADFDGALADNLAVVDELRRAGDWIALTRLHVNVGSIQSFRRDFDAAEMSLNDAIALAEQHGQALLSGYAHHNLGHIRALRGEVPTALAAFDLAKQRYVELDALGELATLMADRARTLADAGLRVEARESVDSAYSLVRDGPNTSQAADIALLTAQIRLADDDPAASIEPAEWAHRAFTDQGCDGWIPVAELVLLRAATSAAPEDLATAAVDLAQRLRDCGWIEEAQTALIVAADRFGEAGEVDRARHALTDATQLDAVTLRSRAARWLAMARYEFLGGDLDAARGAVDAGLDLLAANRSLLGAVELLARSIEAGEALTQLGIDIELRRGDAAGVLDVLRRAMVVELAVEYPLHADTEMADQLAELRHTVAEIRTVDQGSDERARLRERQAELEDSIRDRSRRIARRRSPTTDRPPPIGAIPRDRLAAVEPSSGTVRMVGLVDGRPLLHQPAAGASVHELVDTVDFALHRLNREGVSAASAQVATAMLDDAADALDRALVPHGVRTSARPLVITPTGGLHGLSWRVLPSLRGRSLTVSTSLGDPPPAHDHSRVLLVAGPDLAHADREIAEIGVTDGRSGRQVTLLPSSEATVERVVADLEATDLAHIACHGSFRADNPLFSALHLADGDLTIYELDACAQLPHTVILSACNAGQSSVLRGGALLGMANALLQMGVASVIAPLNPVNDSRLVPIMRALHGRLADGADAATALADVSIDGEGNLDPTAASFVCFGR